MNGDKNEVFYIVFKIMREAKRPVSQTELIKLIQKESQGRLNYSYLYQLFTPSLLQPFWSREQKEFVDPVIIKVDDSSDVRGVFQLNPEYVEATLDDFQKKLRFTPYDY